MFAYPVPAQLLRDGQDGVEGRVQYFGPRTAALEERLARVCGVPRAVAVSSGSVALRLALRACAVGAGDEVIMPANVHAAVLDAALRLGAAPVMVDVEEDTGNIDPDRVAGAVTPRTRALAVQHTFGHPVDMDPLVALAQRHGFWIIEDAAHALGARYRGRPAGGLGDAAALAFSNKGISACGVGGAVVTRHRALADDVMRRRNQGDEDSRGHRAPGPSPGPSGHALALTEFVAAVASFQLGLLDGWNARRRASAARYLQRFAALGLPVRPQAVRPYAHHAYLHVAIRVGDRDGLRRHLAARGVDARASFYPPAYLHHAVRGRVPYRRGDFPIAEALCEECLSLPAHPGAGEREVDYVVEQVAEFFRRNVVAQ